jgi:hypothetical protein
MSLSRHATSPPLDRARVLWAGFAWLLTIAHVSIGLLYLVFGSAAGSSADAYTLVLRYTSWRVHGAVMVIIGLSLIYGLIAPLYRVETISGRKVRLPMRDHYLRRVALPLVIGYQLLMVISFAGSWMITGHPTAVQIVWRAVIIAWAALLIEIPAPAMDGPGRAR